MVWLAALAAGACLFVFFGVIGLLIKTAYLSDENRRLSRRLDELAETLAGISEKGVIAEAAGEGEAASTSAPPDLLRETIRPLPPEFPSRPENPEIPSPEPLCETPGNAAPPALVSALRGFLKSGNAWAAGGITLLVAGFATLLAYLARRGFFTLEMGIVSAALSGLAMLAAGWAFRKKRRAYCLLLQGGGIGLLYLSVFAAHRLTPWFSPSAALVLLSALVPPAVILALLQRSEPLALFGFLGGFAAPLLISAGAENHVFLFSYYTVLNLGVFAAGIFRFWRGLNLLAFCGTFFTAIYWVSRSYTPELFWSAEPFFAGYILIFTLLGLHGFGKKIFQKDAYFDGTLLLGTPVLGAVLQWRVFGFIPHGRALVSLAFAAFYLGLAVCIWKRNGKTMRLFAEGYLGLTVLLANLAVPLELAPLITSAVWAAEGALFYFFGCRLKNARAVILALALHAAAALAFAADRRADGAAAFLNPAFSGSLVISLAAMALIIITVQFRAVSPGGAAAGRRASPLPAEGFFSAGGIFHTGFIAVLALWFYAWWFGGWFAELRGVDKDAGYSGAYFLFCALTAAAGFAGSKLLRCPAMLLGLVPSMASGAVLALGVIFRRSIGSFHAPVLINFFHDLYIAGWPVFFAAHGTAAALIKKDVPAPLRAGWAFTLILIAAATLSSSGRALTVHFGLAPSWRSFAGLLPLFAGMLCLSAAVRKPKTEAGDGVSRKLLFFVLPLVFSCILGLWFLVTLFLSGDPAPLPRYIPLVNPLDLLEAFSILIFLFWQANLAKSGESGALSKRALFAIADAALLLFVTALLARSLHFYAGLPYRNIFAAEAFQLGLLLLWALYGVAHIVAGTRLGRRKLWIAGAVITVIDIAKLLILDLAGAGTVIRIISFFAAGIILLFIGWVSPLPPADIKE